MATQTASEGFRTRKAELLSQQQWLRIGLVAALVAIALVLPIQALATAFWPEIAAFKPLDNYLRTAVFTLIPALVATALFARLAQSRNNPAAAFVKIAFIVLLVSFIPDYALPVPDKTFLASSVAAFLHLIAGIAITGVIIAGYNRAVKKL